MNKQILIILVLIVSCISYAQNSNQKDAEGKRHGIWQKDFNGTKVLRYKGQFNHGQEVGTFKFYKNLDGQSVLTATKTYNNSNDLADVTFYSSTKKIISKGKMRGKTYIGKWVYYHNKSKVVMTEENYNESGYLDGVKKTFYLNGQLAQLEHYNAGVLVGESRWFSELGKVIRIVNYENGELHGLAKSFDAKGRLEQEGVYQKDRRHGIWKFYKNGKLTKQQDFTRRSKNPYKK